MTTKIKRKEKITIPITLQNHKVFSKLSDLIPKTLQGDLKYCKNEDIEKLEKSILKYGFNTIVYLWQDPETKKVHISDGNHRVIAANNLVTKKDYILDKIPVAFQKAKTLKEAKALILSNSVKVATISKIAMATFLDEAEFSIPEIEEVGSHFTDTNLDFGDVVNIVSEVAEDNEPIVDSKEKDDSPASHFYIIIDCESEKTRSDAIKKLDKNLSFSTCTEKDMKFK